MATEMYDHSDGRNGCRVTSSRGPSLWVTLERKVAGEGRPGLSKRGFEMRVHEGRNWIPLMAGIGVRYECSIRTGFSYEFLSTLIVRQGT